MRIIGGTFKGVKILEAFDKNTRPLKDLVKESILNILEHSKDSKINLNKLSRNDELLKDYALKSNSQIIGEIYSTYDLSLNEKYNVKLFQNTIERVKNNFR